MLSENKKIAGLFFCSVCSRVLNKNFGSVCQREESFFSADGQYPVRNVCTISKLKTVQNKFVKEISFQKNWSLNVMSVTWNCTHDSQNKHTCKKLLFDNVMMYNF